MAGAAFGGQVVHLVGDDAFDDRRIPINSDGTFEITLDDEVFPAAKDDRIWVARGARHRMHNTGETPARILEIAYGTFDEDDIVRIEDDYQR